MVIEEECVVSGTMAKLLRLASLAGCTSLKLQPLGATNYIARTTKPKYQLTSIFLFILHFSLICSVFSLLVHVNDDDSTTTQRIKPFIFACVDIFTKLFITTIVKTSELHRIKRFIQYYESIEYINKTLNKVHKKFWYDQTSAKKYEKTFARMLTCFLICYSGWIVTILIMALLNNLTFGGHNVTLVFVNFVGSIVGIYTCLTIAQILLMITITNSALFELNFALDELVSALDRSDNCNDLATWKYFEMFYELSDAYVVILETVRKIKRNEGVHLLLLLSNTCFNLFILGYATLFFISAEPVSSTYIYSYAELSIAAITLITKVFLLVDPGHQTQQAVQDTKVIVGSLMCRMSSSYIFSHDRKQFSKQLLFQPTAYSVLNICTIDRSLITKIFAMVVTNLVTIMQI